MTDFEGKVALVTGASSGIGYTTSLMMAARGCALAISGRKLENLEKLRDEILASNEQAKTLIVAGDVTIEDDVERIVKSTIDHYSRLDILVNNAGILESGGIENTSLDQYDRVMNTNVRSVMHLSMLSVPHLIKTQGCIVNVSSITGLRSFPGVLSYCMSKGAVDQMTRCMALDLAQKQVRVNSVNPGVIITELHKRSGMSTEQYADFVERGVQTHPLGRCGTTTEVAEAICFLADGKRSSFMTGNTISVDGGKHAVCPR